jgi:hypothetical protein
VGSIVVADSCAVVGAPEGTVNVTLNALVVAQGETRLRVSAES